MLEQQKFQFNVECKSLEAALKKAASVFQASASTVAFFLASNKGKLNVVGMSQECLAVIVVDGADVKGDGALSLSRETLEGIIKGRSNMVFTFNGSELEFKQLKGKYSGKVVVLPITNDNEATFEAMFSSKSKGNNAVLPGDFLDAMKSCIKATSIKDVFNNTSLLVYISHTKGNLTVTSLDNQHFGKCSVDIDTKASDFKIALPTSHFNIIDTIAKGENAKFYLNAGSVRVEGKNFVVVLPATSAKEEAFTLVDKLLSAVSKPEFVASYDQKELSKVLVNLITLFAVNTSITFEAKDSTELKVSFNTQSGSASDVLSVASKSKNKLKASVEPRLIKDVVDLSNVLPAKEYVMKIYDKVVLMYGNADEYNTVYGCYRME